MNATSRPLILHTLNSLHSQQATELAASTPAAFSSGHDAGCPESLSLLPPSSRVASFLFDDVPDRVQLGVDMRWNHPLRRMLRHRRERRVPDLLRNQQVDRRGHVEIAAAGSVEVNGARRRLILGLVLQAVAVLAIVGFICLRRVF